MKTSIIKIREDLYINIDHIIKCTFFKSYNYVTKSYWTITFTRESVNLSEEEFEILKEAIYGKVTKINS